MSYNATTKLDLVNLMLASIGESPVSALSSGLTDAELAETIIGRIDRETQSEGWWFNTDYNKKFVPDGESKQVVLPLNTLKIDCVGTSSHLRMIQRKVGTVNKLYDPYNHTYDVGDNHTSIYIDIVTQEEFENLPESAKRYIGIKSSRRFSQQVIGNAQLYGYEKEDEARSLAELKEAESQIAGHNVFDEYSVYRVVNRDHYGTQRLRLGFL
tara:strand:+ start:11149 stop:11784 length:636 start_codon:yes stop_codon:yes gene_type:complete